MLALRIAAILAVLVTAAGIVLFLVTRDKKYLSFALQVFKYAAIFALLGLRRFDSRACNCARLSRDLLAVPGRELPEGDFQSRIRELLAEPSQSPGGFLADFRRFFSNLRVGRWGLHAHLQSGNLDPSFRELLR